MPATVIPISPLPPPAGGWRLLYTRSRCEQTVCQALARRRRTAIAPTYATPAGGQLPLFPGYVFVDPGADVAADRDLESTPHVVCLVRFGGAPALVPEAELQPILTASRERAELRPGPFLPCGTRMRITDGPLRGVEGVLQRGTRGGARLVLNIELLRSAAALEVDLSQVERVNGLRLLK